MLRQNTVYLSDLLAVPSPAPSRRAYRRKRRLWRLLWAVLPWLLQTIALLALVLLTAAGIAVCAVGLN